MTIAPGDLRRALESVLAPITATPIDRQGDPVFFDGFEDGLARWRVSSPGTGASIELSTVEARQGRFSTLFTGGSGAALGIALSGFVIRPQVTRAGLEFSFQLPGTIDDLRWSFLSFDGTNRRWFRIEWSDADNELSYLNSGGTLTVFATGVDLGIQPTHFHTGKLVVDLSTGQYVRFLLDDTIYTTDLAGNAAWQTANTDAPTLEMQLQLTSRSGNNDQCYVDDVLATVNEPA